MGILKSKSVCINQIAASLRDSFRLKDVARPQGTQDLKEDNTVNIPENHPCGLGCIVRYINSINIFNDRLATMNWKLP